MRTSYGLLRESASRLAEAARRTLPSLANTAIEQEPHFTDRMLGRIEEAMHGYTLKGVKWSAKTLTDHGRGTQEKKYGADFVGVLDVNLPDYKVRKGFLAQSKLLKTNATFTRAEFARLQKQCDDMLKLSPASFVFVYSPSDIYVIPAISIVSTGFCYLTQLYKRGISRFFEEHFESFIGDRNVNQPTRKGLEDLNARHLLLLGLSEG